MSNNETWIKFPKVFEGIYEIGQRINKNFQSALENIAEFNSRFIEVAKTLAEAVRPFSVISKLGEAQFVYWDFLNDDFVDEILSSDDIDKTLYEILIKDKFRKVNITIDMCSRHPLIASYNRIFSQTVTAYRNKHYDLAAIGIMSVIDGVLSDIGGDTTTSIFRRANDILRRVEETDSLENDECAVLALIWTFRETMESISARSDFNGKEPKNLNRHWIMHGRSRRKRTHLDCIKLFNFLYGILLISELGKEK